MYIVHFCWRGQNAYFRPSKVLKASNLDFWAGCDVVCCLLLHKKLAMQQCIEVVTFWSEYMYDSIWCTYTKYGWLRHDMEPREYMYYKCFLLTATYRILPLWKRMFNWHKLESFFQVNNFQLKSSKLRLRKWKCSPRMRSVIAKLTRGLRQTQLINLRLILLFCLLCNSIAINNNLQFCMIADMQHRSRPHPHMIIICIHDNSYKPRCEDPMGMYNTQPCY